MNIKIEDVMSSQVIRIGPRQFVGRARELMAEHGIHALPVVDSQEEPVGIVTSSDVLHGVAEGAAVAEVMSKKVLTVPRYSDVSLAARVMRKHHLHHVIVTHERKVVGVVSTFDLLQLVENKRFTLKNAPTPSKKKSGRSRKGAEPE